MDPGRNSTVVIDQAHIIALGALMTAPRSNGRQRWSCSAAAMGQAEASCQKARPAYRTSDCEAWHSYAKSTDFLL